MPALKHPDWKVRRAAMVALAMVAEGCAEPLREALDRMMPLLMPLVRVRFDVDRQGHHHMAVRTLPVACCMLHVACCMLHVAWICVCIFGVASGVACAHVLLVGTRMRTLLFEPQPVGRWDSGASTSSPTSKSACSLEEVHAWS